MSGNKANVLTKRRPVTLAKGLTGASAWAAECTQDSFQLRRQRRCKGHAASMGRVVECEPFRMQEESSESGPFAHLLIARGVALVRVARDRMTCRAEMQSQLPPAAGAGRGLDERAAAEAFEHAEFRSCRTRPGSADNRDGSTSAAHATERDFDAARGPRDVADHERQVALLDRAAAETFPQRAVGRGVSGDDHQPRRVPVEPVNHPEIMLRSHAIQPLAIPGDQAVEDGVQLVPYPRLADHPRGFVKNQDVGVFMDYAELDLWIRRDKVGALGQVKGDFLAGPKAGSARRGFSVNKHKSFAYQAVKETHGRLRTGPGKEVAQRPPVILPRDEEPSARVFAVQVRNRHGLLASPFEDRSDRRSF